MQGTTRMIALRPAARRRRWSRSADRTAKRRLKSADSWRRRAPRWLSQSNLAPFPRIGYSARAGN
eukprot:8985005-Pyramimonas_sp.AAC.1